MLEHVHSLSLLAQSSSANNSAVIAFGLYIGLVLFLAWLSNRVVHRSGFLSEYFLGGRSLGVWAFALTFAATSASGGSFIGFPALVYSHGWSLALWIGSYMLVPLVSMGLLSKRLNQVARKTDAITIPDLILERFQSSVLGLVATSLIVFFMTFNLIAQFKGGSIILQTLLSDIPAFQSAAQTFGSAVQSFSIVQGVDPAYLLCLGVFALAVVAYTTYGGFRAVVWTDVMQGIVMVVGILILLPLTLIAVGGLGNVSRFLASSSPTYRAEVALQLQAPSEQLSEVTVGQPLYLPADSILRVSTPTGPKGLRTLSATRVNQVGVLVPDETDRFGRSRIGAWIFDLPDNADTQCDWKLLEEYPEKLAYGDSQPGGYAFLPGPDAENGHGFLPFAAAFSFFLFWCFGNAGHPSNMVRSMAFRSSGILAKAIFTVSIYYSLIYFPIVVIFCCARYLLPGWEAAPDRIMPEMAAEVTALFGVPWLAGLLVAAPFAAVMSTMDSFLLLISSSVVRDIYLRWMNPEASDQRVKTLTYVTTFLIGAIAMAAAINPPQFLQDIIVFTGEGVAAAFLFPVALALYWPRFNAPGAIAGMLGGFTSNIMLYAVGSWQAGSMAALKPFGFSPFVIGLLVSGVASISLTLLTRRPPEHLVVKFFYREREPAG